MTAKPFQRSDLKIAVIGGGTGSFTLLSSLKEHTKSIVALVNMADDGGSSGMLRDELGVLPPGDVRQCLVALSGSSELRDLFNYRFDEGGLRGHAFGNLFLTALEKMTGSFARGIEVASQVLDITGVVEPITLTNVRLVMCDAKGEKTYGEFKIREKDFSSPRPDFWLEPLASVNPKALIAIEEADIVVIAPGHLYGTLAPALIVPGIGRALAKSKAFKVYICNLVTKPGQTDDYTVIDFADEIERLAGEPFLDAVLFNTEKPSADLMKKYAAEGELAVVNDKVAARSAQYAAVGARLLSSQIWSSEQDADPIASTRTFIRHDSKAVANAIVELYDHTRQQG
jgi:uncharacterized cofD-like protein